MEDEEEDICTKNMVDVALSFWDVWECSLRIELDLMAEDTAVMMAMVVFLLSSSGRFQQDRIWSDDEMYVCQ